MLPPFAKLQRVSDATVEPLSLASARQYLRVEIVDPDEDALIEDLITAARLRCEQIANSSFVSTGWLLTLDYLPVASGLFWDAWETNGRSCQDGVVELPMPPLLSLGAISYVDQGGITRTLDPSTIVVSPGTPGRITSAYGRYFPFSRPQIASAQIAYTAGYGPDASFVPKVVAQAIRLLVSLDYNNRLSESTVMQRVEDLLSTVRCPGYG